MIIYLFMILFAIILLFLLTSKLIDTITSSSAPAIPTPKTALTQIHKALDISASNEVWEIGCGDGRVLSFCAKKHPKNKFIGIDNGIQMFILAKWRTRKQNNIQIIYGDFKKITPKKTVKIYLYLLPQTIQKYKKNIPRGSRVVSLEYKIPNKKPIRVINLNTQTKLAHRLYVYQF